MNRHRIVQPEGWPRPSGYSNGLSSRGRVVTVAGQVGWNPRTCRFEADEFAAQARQALENVMAVLKAGGASPMHVVRMTWFIVDRRAYLDARPAVGKAYREIMGDHYPAMSLVVVAGLLEEKALIEIEATAMVPE